MSDAFQPIDDLLRAAAERRDPPGAVALIGCGGQIRHHAAYGKAALVPSEEEMKAETLFDVASLTKPFAASLVAMRLIDAGKIALEDPVSKFFTHYQWGDKGKVRVKHLLTNTSGLKAWHPFFQETRVWSDRDKVKFEADSPVRKVMFALVEAEPLRSPPEQVELYSDLGYILLTGCLEKAGGAPLDELFKTLVSEPLGLSGDLQFRPLNVKHADEGRSIASTLECPWRKRVLRGQVHDDNAYVMRGVSGHAGLFATAEALFRAGERLAACRRGEDQFVKPETAKAFLRRHGLVEKGTWAYGWDTPSPQGSTAGAKFGPETFGHNGFTGCSFWMDLPRRRTVVLLTNRIHPKIDKEGIKELRPKFHDLANEALDRAG